jgi:hypothetical protein
MNTIQIILIRSFAKQADDATYVIDKSSTGDYFVQFRDSVTRRNESFIIPATSLPDYLKLIINTISIDSHNPFECIQISIPKFPDFILKNDSKILENSKIVLDLLKFNQ